MPYLPKNPFSREDWFSELVRIDKDVKTTLKTSYTNFQIKYNPQSMTRTQKILTFFTTHTITAVVTASICLGGIATFAAQTTAPEQYKPSTVINNLFKNNKVQQTNPNTPLVSDNNNDVVSYDPCNISIKFPKQLAGEKIIAVQPKDYYNAEDKTLPNYFGVSIKSQKNFDYDNTTKIANSVSISCSINNDAPLDPQTQTQLSIKELSDITGWFITADQGISEIQSQDQNIYGPSRSIIFKYKNLYYRINFVDKTIPESVMKLNSAEQRKVWLDAVNTPGIFGDQIQIQFNNVAKNIANTQVQNLNGVPTSGELFKYDVELSTTGLGLEWELTDNKTNDKYVIKGDELNKKAEELASKNNGSNNNQNNGIRGSGGLTYNFSGKVKDQDGIINTPNTYLITGIDKFEVKKSNSDSNSNIIYKENIKLYNDLSGHGNTPGYFNMTNDNVGVFVFPNEVRNQFSEAPDSEHLFSGEVVTNEIQVQYRDGNSKLLPTFTVKKITKLEKSDNQTSPVISPDGKTRTFIGGGGEPLNNENNSAPVIDPKEGYTIYGGGKKVEVKPDENNGQGLLNYFAKNLTRQPSGEGYYFMDEGGKNIYSIPNKFKAKIENADSNNNSNFYEFQGEVLFDKNEFGLANWTVNNLNYLFIIYC